MMNEKDIELGTIIMLDTPKKSGIIQSKLDGKLLYFQLPDVEMGTPKEGENVQFVKDTSGAHVTAKKVVVLSSAARKALQSKR